MESESKQIRNDVYLAVNANKQECVKFYIILMFLTCLNYNKKVKNVQNNSRSIFLDEVVSINFTTRTINNFG